jgi:hypothetical protein
VLAVPGPSEGALADHLGCDGGVGRDQGRAVEVDAVLVLEGGVGALPGRDAAAAAAEGEGRFLDVERAEAVEEVGLSGDDGVVEVGVAKLPDVDLRWNSE